MKKIIALALISFAGLTGEAGANCFQNQVLGGGFPNNLGPFLTGKYVCAKRGADTWREEHKPGGELWDLKQGVGHPVDPYEPVGSWSVTTLNNQVFNTYVTYDYGTGGAYHYKVFSVGGTSANPQSPFDFCEVNPATGQLTSVIPKVTNAVIRAAPPCENPWQ